MRFRPILRRLFRPAPLMDQLSTADDRVGDSISRDLDKAVSAHESASEIERGTNARALREALNDCMKRLEARA